MIDRRTFLGTAMLAGIPGMAGAAPRFEDELKRLEAASGGRLGVALVEGRGARPRGWRGDERFPMCSTFKVLASAALLHRVEAGQDKLDRCVTYTKADLVPYSPETKSTQETASPWRSFAKRQSPCPTTPQATSFWPVSADRPG